MAYVRAKPNVVWDRNGTGLFDGVTIRHYIGNQWHQWQIHFNGVVTQAMAADILDVSLMAVNNWARGGLIKVIKPQGQAAVIPLSEIKRVRKILMEHGRLIRAAMDE